MILGVEYNIELVLLGVLWNEHLIPPELTARWQHRLGDVVATDIPKHHTRSSSLQLTSWGPAQVVQAGDSPAQVTLSKRPANAGDNPTRNVRGKHRLWALRTQEFLHHAARGELTESE